MTKTAKILLALPMLLTFTACDKDDPISESKVRSAEISCTYSISPEMLRYFDYKLNYTDDYGYTSGMDLDRPAVSLDLISASLPTERFFKFEVTRTDAPAPTETVKWEQTFEVKVTRQFKDGHTDTVTETDKVTYTVKPGEFEKWASRKYIPVMAHGYEVYVNYAGDVNFSFD